MQPKTETNNPPNPQNLAPTPAKPTIPPVQTDQIQKAGPPSPHPSNGASPKNDLSPRLTHQNTLVFSCFHRNHF